MESDCEFIYLFKYLKSATMGSVHINTKERQVRRVKEKKRIEAQRVKHPTPSQAIDGQIGMKNRTENR